LKFRSGAKIDRQQFALRAKLPECFSYPYVRMYRTRIF
jgi:hypothetical protein